MKLKSLEETLHSFVQDDVTSDFSEQTSKVDEEPVAPRAAQASNDGPAQMALWPVPAAQTPFQRVLLVGVDKLCITPLNLAHSQHQKRNPPKKEEQRTK